MMGKPGRRISLSVKLYILIIVILLAVSSALLFTGYRTYSRKVEESYFSRAERAARTFSTYPDHYLANMVARINTEAFRKVREEAAAAGDEGMIDSWLLQQPGITYGYFSEEELQSPDKALSASLHGDMNLLRNWCKEYMEHYDVTVIYIQYMENGVTYNIVDPNEDLLYIGSIEEPLKEFEGYKDNERVPPTIYHSSRGWLCTT